MVVLLRDVTRLLRRDRSVAGRTGPAYRQRAGLSVGRRSLDGAPRIVQSDRPMTLRTNPRSQDPRDADAAAFAARRDEVYAALAQVLPADILITGREQTQPYECDGLTAFRALPMIV